jgi:hypothetical protein
MLKKHTLCAAIACVLCIGLRGNAMAQAAEGKIDAEKKKLIMEMIEVTDLRQSLEAVYQNGLPNLRGLFYRIFPDAPTAKVDSLIDRKFNTSAMLEVIIPVYDKHLTLDDLKASIDFYKTPAGKRMAKVLPQITIESSEAGKKMGEKAAYEILNELEQMGYKPQSPPSQGKD